MAVRWPLVHDAVQPLSAQVLMADYAQQKCSTKTACSNARTVASRFTPLSLALRYPKMLSQNGSRAHCSECSVVARMQPYLSRLCALSYFRGTL